MQEENYLIKYKKKEHFQKIMQLKSSDNYYML